MPECFLKTAALRRFRYPSETASNSVSCRIWLEAAISLFTSDTRLKPICRLQEGGANVYQRTLAGFLVCFDTGAERRECCLDSLAGFLVMFLTPMPLSRVSDINVCPKDSRFYRSFIGARPPNGSPEQNDPANREQNKQQAVKCNSCYYRFPCKPFQSIHWYSTPGVVVFSLLASFR